MKIHLLLIGLLMVAFNLGAEPRPDYPKVDDASYTEPNGDRVIKLSTEVPAAPEEIWRVLTTSEGWKSYAVAFAQIDMQVGGIIETSYNPKAKAGDTNNIKNQIVAYVPGRMLAMRCVQAPAGFEHKDEFFATATVLEIIPVDKTKSKVVATGVGFRPGEAYDDLFKKFRWGDAYTLDKLRLRFDPAAAAAEAEIAKRVDASNPKPKEEKK